MFDFISNGFNSFWVHFNKNFFNSHQQNWVLVFIQINYKMVPTNEFELVVHNSFKLPKTKLKSYGLVQSDHKYCEYMRLFQILDTYTTHLKLNQQKIVSRIIPLKRNLHIRP